MAEKKCSGSLKTSSGWAPPRIVSVITDKEGFLIPVVKGAIGVKGSSLVTWSSLAAKSTSETVEETASVSEGEASASKSSSYNTPMMFKVKQLREPLSRVATKNKNIITSRVEPEEANYVLVSLDEWDELNNLMIDANDEMRHTADELKRYINKDSKIGEIASSADMKKDYVRDKLNEVLSKKCRRSRRQMDRPAEVNASTQTFYPTAQVEGPGRASSRKVVEHRSKRKIVSPPQDRKVADMKEAKRADTSYAEICWDRRRNEADLVTRETCDTGGEWTVQMSRRYKRRLKERSNNGESRPPINKRQGERKPGISNRPEALLVKLRKDEDWIQKYRELMGVKEALSESTGVRCTKGGDIFVELKAGIKGGDVALKIKKAIGDRFCVIPLLSRVSVEVKDIDQRGRGKVVKSSTLGHADCDCRYTDYVYREQGREYKNKNRPHCCHYAGFA